MKIYNYYIFSDGKPKGYCKVSGELILKRRRVVKPISTKNNGKFPNNAIPQEFKYIPADSRYIANPIDSEGKQINIQSKLLIIEIDIKSGEHINGLHEEYLIDKTWWNIQRLSWMFGVHWIQKDFRFWFPFIISTLSLIIAFFTLQNSSNLREHNRNIRKELDSLIKTQSKLNNRLNEIENLKEKMQHNKVFSGKQNQLVK